MNARRSIKCGEGSCVMRLERLPHKPLRPCMIALENLQHDAGITAMWDENGPNGLDGVL